MHCVMQADQINCLKPLEIWDFLLDLASRQPAPELKRTIWCVFSLGINACEATVTISPRYTCKIYLLCLDLPALLIFMFGVPPVRGG